MLAQIGSNAESLAFAVSSSDDSAMALQRPTGFPSIVAVAPDMLGGMLWIWQIDSGSGLKQLVYGISNGSNGQIGAARTLPLQPAESLQAWILAQDANGNALVRWASGPLDNAGQPTLGGLLRFTASTQAWSAVALPNPLLSAMLLFNSKAVFDANGRAWLIQPTPGTMAGEWTLATYSLIPGASNWTTVAQLPVSSPRSVIFQLSIDARNRLVLAHSVVHNAAIESVPLSIARYDPQGAGWSELPAPGLPSVGYVLQADAPGNIWALSPYAQVYGTNSVARFDNAANTWNAPKKIDFASADGLQDGNGNWPLALATDSKGNAWAVGIRSKVPGQDLPVLWINVFNSSSRQWSQSGSLTVQGGENAAFVQPAQGGSSTSFQVALSLDEQDRPVAVVTEILRPSRLSYTSRTWFARGQAA